MSSPSISPALPAGSAGLIELPASWPVVVDLRYATADNLTGRPIYRQPRCLLHADAAAALYRAALLARAQDLTLRIFDAFRPTEAQWQLWQAVSDPEFIADPHQGSTHSRGVAVDLTLQTAAGEVLDMGTGFDDLTALSHHGVTGIGAAALRHRGLLLGIMIAAGWQHYPFEWWHYQLPDAGRYPLLTDSAAGGRLMAG